METKIPKFVKLVDDAILPNRATKGSAGYDLYANEDIVIPVRGRVLVKTGIGWDMGDTPVCGFIKSRSSLAYKLSLDAEAGVIDSDYKDEIKVLLANNGANPATINKNSRIAQLVILPYAVLMSEEDVTESREGGFGSTGN